MNKRFSIYRLKAFVLTTVVICLASTGAYAQAVLEEVLVTAQKREQNMQDVPVSISAFTGEALRETVIKDMFDLQAHVPGLRVGQSQNSTTSSFAICRLHCIRMSAEESDSSNQALYASTLW